jgi:hypothetical protein
MDGKGHHHIMQDKPSSKRQTLHVFTRLQYLDKKTNEDNVM